MLALVGQKTDKVDYWKNSDQKQRWVATALLDIEPRLNRVCGYRYLKNLKNALQREILQGKRKEAVAPDMQHRGHYRISTNNGIDTLS